MKVGMRKPSIKKSVKARTTRAVKRKAKKSVNPLYGKSGMGYLKDPEKAIKNKIYHKTTVGLNDIISFDNTDDYDADDYEFCTVSNKDSSRQQSKIEELDEKLKKYNEEHKRVPTEKELKRTIKLSKYALLPLSIFLILISIAFKDWIFTIIGVLLLIFSIYMIKTYKKQLNDMNVTN